MQPLMADRRTAELQNPANLGYVLWDTFLVEPVFEESGFAEVLFPEGHRWLYYFNRSLVFEGRGQRQALGFKLSEAPLFVRSDSVVPVGDELWLVHLSPGRHARQVVAGDYSDSVAVSSSGRQTTVEVRRFYRTEEVRRARQDRTLRVRLLGVARPQPQAAETAVEATEYEDEFYVSVELNTTAVFLFGQQATIEADE